VHYKWGVVKLNASNGIDTCGVFVDGRDAVARLSHLSIDGTPGTDGTVGLLAWGGSIFADNIQFLGTLPGASPTAVTVAFGVDEGGFLNVINSTANGGFLFSSNGPDSTIFAENVTGEAAFAIAQLFHSGTLRLHGCELTGPFIETRSLEDDQDACITIELSNTKLKVSDGQAASFETRGCAKVSLIGSEVDQTSDVLVRAQGDDADLTITLEDGSYSGFVTTRRGGRVTVQLASEASWTGSFDSSKGLTTRHVVIDSASEWNVTRTCWVESISNGQRDFTNIFTASPEVVVWYNARNEDNAHLGAHDIMLTGGGKLAPYLPE
jgi:hypothetical protein